MSRRSYLPSARSLSRAFLFTSVSLVGGLIAISCLTPDFAFDEAAPTGDGDLGEGGDGNVDPVGSGGNTTVSHCENRTKDQDETDSDCGGLDCEPCALGRSCEVGDDCVNGSCTAGKCQMPTCTDDEKNDTETDVDCGGDGCPPCGVDEKCLDNSDCESLSCSGGECAAPTCTDRITNGNESDLDCGGSCDPCESGEECVVPADCIQPPEEDPSVSTCEDGICTLVCDSRHADCNAKAVDGCEIDIFTNIDHCGACDSFCNPANSEAAKCNDGVCEVDSENGGCTAPFLNCNGLHDDGCEVNSNTDAAHCGTCFEACSDDNGTPECVGGACQIDCSTGFEDCDGNPRDNGCEINTNTNAVMCGDCDTDCRDFASSNQSAYCDAGMCGATDCDPGVGDCDGDGVCSNNLNTVANCGECGQGCAATNATVACVDQGGSNYQCEIATCVDGPSLNYEDCDGQYANGCEVNVLTNVNHCGGCAGGGGQSCTALANNTALHIASVFCDTGTCKVNSCTTGYADCDGSAANGCEVHTQSDDTRCGGCSATDANAGSGENCNDKWANANGNCNLGACEFTGCESTNWGNCANGLTDGCETDLRITEAHCGACGTVCQTDSYTSSNTCTSKACFAVCNSNGAKCDADENNGCENIATDANNCGSCGNECGGNAGNVASATCSAKSCNVTCNNDLCPDSTSEAECTLDLGTTSNCSACGEVCSGDNNICTINGCDDHLPIQVVKTHNFTGLNNPNTSSSFTLFSSSSTTRGLILAVAATRNPAQYVSAKITWNSGSNEAAMALAHRQTIYTADASIFYLKHADLPAAGTTINVVLSSGETWGGVVASIIEVTDMYQTGTPYTEAAGTEYLPDCGSISISRTAAVTYEDSLIVAVVQAQGNSGTGSPTNLTEIQDAFTNHQTHGLVGYRLNSTANISVGFSAITGCWDTILTTTTFRPWAP